MAEIGVDRCTQYIFRQIITHDDVSTPDDGILCQLS
jgi:hypothetical protein